METQQELRRRVAFLESRLDQLESEFTHLNGLLLECGFPEGVQSLVVTIEDLLGGEGIPENPNATDKPQTFDLF